MKECPTIETHRLLLNAPTAEDIDTIVSVLNHKVYADNAVMIPYPYTAQSAQYWLQLAADAVANESGYIFAIRLKESPTIIGGIELSKNKSLHKAEIGYWLDQKYWNHGLMTEAVQAVLQFGFETIKLKKIYATHFDYNLASGKVMQKAGMTQEAILRCHTYKEGVYHDHVMYSLIK